MQAKLAAEIDTLNKALDDIPDDDYFFTLVKRGLVVLEEKRTNIRAVLKEYLSYHTNVKTEEDLKNLTNLEKAKLKKSITPILEYYDVIPSAPVKIATPIRNVPMNVPMKIPIGVRSRRNQRGGVRWNMCLQFAGSAVSAVIGAVTGLFSDYSMPASQPPTATPTIPTNPDLASDLARANEGVAVAARYSRRAQQCLLSAAGIADGAAFNYQKVTEALNEQREDAKHIANMYTAAKEFADLYSTVIDSAKKSQLISAISVSKSRNKGILDTNIGELQKNLVDVLKQVSDAFDAATNAQAGTNAAVEIATKYHGGHNTRPLATAARASEQQAAQYAREAGAHKKKINEILERALYDIETANPPYPLIDAAPPFVGSATPSYTPFVSSNPFSSLSAVKPSAAAPPFVGFATPSSTSFVPYKPFAAYSTVKPSVAATLPYGYGTKPGGPAFGNPSVPSYPKPKTLSAYTVESPFGGIVHQPHTQSYLTPASAPSPAPAPPPASQYVRTFDIGGSGVKTLLFINNVPQGDPQALGICPVEAGFNSRAFFDFLRTNIPTYAAELDRRNTIIFVSTAGKMDYLNAEREYVITDDWKAGGIPRSKKEWPVDEQANGVSLRTLFGIQGQPNIILYAARDSYAHALSLTWNQDVPQAPHYVACIALGTGVAISIFRKRSDGSLQFFPKFETSVPLDRSRLHNSDPLKTAPADITHIYVWELLGFTNNSEYGSYKLYDLRNNPDFTNIKRHRVILLMAHLNSHCVSCGLISMFERIIVYVSGSGAIHLSDDETYTRIVSPNTPFDGYKYMIQFAGGDKPTGREFALLLCPKSGGMRKTRRQRKIKRKINNRKYN